jgi:hypothetical protein
MFVGTIIHMSRLTIIVLLLTLAAVAGLTGCGSNEQSKCHDACQQEYDECMDAARSAIDQYRCDSDRQVCQVNCKYGSMSPLGPDVVDEQSTVDSVCCAVAR